jgi:hypothetical protein
VVLVDAEVVKDAVDATPAPTAGVEMLAEIGRATNEPPERNVLTNFGLAEAKVARGWVVVASIAGS